MMTLSRVFAPLVLSCLLGTGSAQATEIKPLPGQTAVRVCADGFNLPYSNKNLEGFDNRIAAIIGEELGLPVEYTWFPQRIGFSRNTIKKVDPKTGRFLCDVAMSVPNERGMLSPTTSYFSSIEAMVYRSNDGFELNQISDVAKVSQDHKKLVIGLFDRGVATEGLLNNGLAEQIKYYQFMSGDAQVNAGRLVASELAAGTIDVAFLWGPIAGYYASVSDVDMTVVPLNELSKDFVFSFGMGVRHQDKKWKEVLNLILEKRKDDITAILAEYNFPSLDDVKPSNKKNNGNK